MVLMIIAGLLILGIAFYQAVQGLFSALIMAVLTVLCAVAAFNFYEPLANLLVPHQGAYAHAVALLAVFVLPLLVLRIIIDLAIPGNVVMGVWADRVGGGTFGLITALVLVGMLMIIVQMLPLPTSILMYQPYDESLAVKDGGPPAWAGEFALGIAKGLSGGSLQPITEGRTFALAHSDLLLDCYALRNRPPGASASALPDAIEATEAYTPSESERARVLDKTPRNPLIAPLVSTKVLAVRVKVDQSARDGTTGWYLLPATHFRLVTDAGGSYYPVGYLTYAGGWRFNTVTNAEGKGQNARIGDILVARPWTASEGPARLFVDWVYRIPAAEKPETLVFRRSSASSLPPVLEGMPAALEGKPPKAVQIALAVKAQVGEVKFEKAPASRIFQIEYMRIADPTRDTMPENLLIPNVPASERPPAFKQCLFEGDRPKSIVIDGPVADTRRDYPKGTKFASGLYLPSQDALLVRVRFTVEASGTPDQETRKFLESGMKPSLLLDDGTALSHKGAWLFHSADGTPRVYLYYDVSLPPDLPVKRDLTEAFLKSYDRKVQAFGLEFIVPANAARSIVAVKFGKPEYEFQPTAPLSCKGR